MIPISKLRTGTKETAFESTLQLIRVTYAIATAGEKRTNTKAKRVMKRWQTNTESLKALKYREGWLFH